MSRKTDALRAMAEQNDSPEEAAIAREKLALLESREPDPEFLTWQQKQAREAERLRLDEEAQRAELVKRWERGEFSGIRVKTGARTKIEYER